MQEAKAMKLGGMLMDAKDCDYSSYWRLGLCCPSCNEPVHLRSGVKVDAYFAHFPKSYGRNFEQCIYRTESTNLSYGYSNRDAISKNQRLETFQKHFLSMIVYGFSNTSYYNIFDEYRIQLFLGEIYEYENNTQIDLEELREKSIERFIQLSYKNHYVLLNDTYKFLQLNDKSFANLKGVVAEVLLYLKTESSREQLSHILTKVISQLENDDQFRETLEIVDCRISSNLVLKALFCTIASIDWIFITDQAYKRLEKKRMREALRKAHIARLTKQSF